MGKHGGNKVWVEGFLVGFCAILEGDIKCAVPSKFYHVYFIVFDSLLLNLKSSKDEKEKRLQEHDTRIMFGLTQILYV